MLAIIPSVAFTKENDPWSVSEENPVIFISDDNPVNSGEPAQTKAEFAKKPFKLLLRFYQKFISPYDGDRCPMYPTCSQYSMEAIHKHGPIIGIIMTADRLIHEADEKKFVPLMQIGTRARFYDPVSNNDFWWYNK